MEQENIKMEQEKRETQNFKVFDLYDLSEIKISDPGLRNVINLSPKLTLKTQGRAVSKMGQTKINIIERLINRLSVSGHRGKKHKLELGSSSGKFSKNTGIVLEAFRIIEKKKGMNPISVLVGAIEKSAPRDEITVIEYGGARYPQAVDVSPLRRVNLSLRYLTQGASDKAFNKKKTIAQALADEIILAYEENGESFAVKKKKESEAQADSSR